MSTQATEAKPTKAPSRAKKASFFKMRAQMLEQGRTNTLMSKTDNMSVILKVYASGGENALHTHPNEDHTFIVLQGKARYYDADGGYREVGKHEGILLPAGAYYWFEAISEESLVLIRIGCRVGFDDVEGRLNLAGEPMPGDSKENKQEPVVYREGEFFE